MRPFLVIFNHCAIWHPLVCLRKKNWLFETCMTCPFCYTGQKAIRKAREHFAQTIRKVWNFSKAFSKRRSIRQSLLSGRANMTTHGCLLSVMIQSRQTKLTLENCCWSHILTRHLSSNSKNVITLQQRGKWRENRLVLSKRILLRHLP